LEYFLNDVLCLILSKPFHPNAGIGREQRTASDPSQKETVIIIAELCGLSLNIEH
jgi:hypothetical protein